MLMCIPMVELLDYRKIVAATAIAGLAVQLSAVLVGGLDYILIVHKYDLRRQPLYVGGPPTRIDVDDVRFNPRYGQLAGHWLLLRVLLGFPPRPGRPAEVPESGTPLYDALLAAGWPGTVHWDFIWMPRTK
jgi:hypothetical protein